MLKNLTIFLIALSIAAAAYPTLLKQCWLPHNDMHEPHASRSTLQIDVHVGTADGLSAELDRRSLEYPEYTAFITGPSRCAASISYLPNGRVHMSAHPRVNGTYVLHVTHEFRSIEGESELCSGSGCAADHAGANMSTVLASVALNYTGEEVLQFTFDVEQILGKEIEENDRKLQYANKGCWRPSSDFADLVVPAQHAGLEWLWQPDHLDAPVFKTASQMRALLNQTGNVLFIGDSLMRTTFQAFVDVALDYQFPYHGIREKWCGRNGTQHFGGLGSLTIDGNGCHSGHASFSLSLGANNVTLSYLAMWYSSQTTLDILVDAGLLDNFSHVFINYGLHDVSMYTRDRFQVHLTARLERLAASRGRMATPRNIVYLGMWAQRLSKKPVDWIWSGSHKRTEVFLEVMRTTARQNNIPFIDTYTMTLPMLEFNADGVHYDERVTRALAMLLASVMTGGQGNSE